MQLLKFEISKFTIVGGINFVLTLLIYAGFMSILQVHYLLALAAAWIAGVLFSYTANMLWVFQIDGRGGSWSSFLRFAFSSGVSVTVNGIVLTYIVEHFSLDPFLAQLLLLPFVIAFNFLATKYWSLRARKSPPRGSYLG